MDYERIHNAQAGVISPSKLRMKLMGTQHQHTKNKDGSNCNSSRTSPSKHEDSEFVKNSLLASRSGDFDEEVSSMDPSMKSFANSLVDVSLYDQSSSQTRENAKMQQVAKMETFHSRRTLEDEVSLSYESNASSSSFEFQNGERSLHHSLTRSLSRPMSSKWNDAEKWIMNSQNGQTNHLKKSHVQNQLNRQTSINLSRFPPEICEQKPSVRRVDFCQTLTQQTEQQQISVSSIVESSPDLCPQTKDLKEVEHKDISSTDDHSGVPEVRSVSMRDMGTEMTPIPSQEPSRSATPLNSTTPIRSPTSSIPSTPRRGGLPAASKRTTTDEEPNNAINIKRELSEEELKLKTRREIVALGVQLGKMNIATWASKEESSMYASTKKGVNSSENKGMEFDKIAAEWEEAEKAKHAARYKREEIQIQAWESQQKAKLEAELQRIEAHVSQMRANAQSKMTKKIAMARQRSEEKRAAAEARRRKEAERTTVQAEYIRRTGRVPSSGYCCCCGGW